MRRPGRARELVVREGVRIAREPFAQGVVGAHAENHVVDVGPAVCAVPVETHLAFDRSPLRVKHKLAVIFLRRELRHGELHLLLVRVALPGRRLVRLRLRVPPRELVADAGEHVRVKRNKLSVIVELLRRHRAGSAVPLERHDELPGGPLCVERNSFADGFCKVQDFRLVFVRRALAVGPCVPAGELVADAFIQTRRKVSLLAERVRLVAHRAGRGTVLVEVDLVVAAFPNGVESKYARGISKAGHHRSGYRRAIGDYFALSLKITQNVVVEAPALESVPWSIEPV